jgi:DNA-binding transcriptional MerR regulator
VQCVEVHSTPGRNLSSGAFSALSGFAPERVPGPAGLFRNLAVPDPADPRSSAVATESFTLPELSKALDVHYRTLHSWVERGLLEPGVQRSKGTGTPNLFNRQDAVMACILVELRAAGVNFELLSQAADRLRLTEAALEQEAFMLVNGDVRIVFDRDQAASALQRGGLTLAYNTGTALERFGDPDTPAGESP